MRREGARFIILASAPPFALWVTLFLALGFLLRLAPLGRYVTPDEPAWVERSIRFADALRARDWSSMPSTGHPGVTTMWLGAAGVTVRTWLNRAESAIHLDWIRRLAWLAPENGEAFRHLSFFLPYGRVAVAAMITLVLGAIAGVLKHLLGRQVALLAVGLLSFEPFLVGHGGLLHTDGLLAIFSTLSVLCVLMVIRGRRPPATRTAALWSAASGLAAGLALLTKSLAGYLVLFAVAALTWAWLQRSLSFLQAIASIALWGSSAAVLYVALYPAVWADPVGTVRDLVSAPAYQSTTALMPTFFAGRTALRHGPQFYLVALPLRLSPVVLVGSLLSIGTWTRRKEFRSVLAWLTMFCAGYLLLLALNVKRYQRYLLPVFGPLIVVAALGLLDLWRSRGWDPRWGVMVLILLQLLLLLPFAARPLTSFDPLLGGPWVGARLLAADWGEGMGTAARWLNQRPDPDELTVAVSSVPSFASLFEGRTVPLEQAALADYLVRSGSYTSSASVEYPTAYTVTTAPLHGAVILTNTAPLQQASYVAARAGADDLILLDTATPFLRRYEGPGTVQAMDVFPDEPSIARYLGEEAPGQGRPTDASIWLVSSPAVSSITAVHLRDQMERVSTPGSSTLVAGATITRYTGASSFDAADPPSYQAAWHEQFALVDATVPEKASWPDALSVVVRWRALASTSADYGVVASLRDGQGHAWSQADMPVINSVFFPTSAWQAGEWSDAIYDIPLPATIPPGTYTVEVSLYHGETGARLGATGAEGRFRGTRIPIGDVAVALPETSPDADGLPIPRRLGGSSGLSVGSLTLLGMTPPPTSVHSGDTLSFALFWHADGVPETDYRVQLTLVSREDDVKLTQIQPLSPYPTTRWHDGSLFQSRYQLRLPPRLSSGRYQLSIDPIDSEGNSIIAPPIDLAMIEVLPRPRSFTLPDDVGQEMDVTFGDTIRLRGYQVGAIEIDPGESLPLTLYWEGKGPTDKSYTLFVHLVGPEGRVYGQVDRIPGEGAVPSTSWANGQMIVEHVSLPLAPEASPGVYHVVVGFYDAAYGGRLPVTGPSGRSVGATQTALLVDIIVSGDLQ